MKTTCPSSEVNLTFRSTKGSPWLMGTIKMMMESHSI